MLRRRQVRASPPRLRLRRPLQGRVCLSYQIHAREHFVGGGFSSKWSGHHYLRQLSQCVTMARDQPDAAAYLAAFVAAGRMSPHMRCLAGQLRCPAVARVSDISARTLAAHGAAACRPRSTRLPFFNNCVPLGLYLERCTVSFSHDVSSSYALLGRFLPRLRPLSGGLFLILGDGS
jgi:hypothetical protein